MNKVVVIGGGAAGMMASIWAAREGAEVVIIESNEKLGKKLFITGKGRCNFTNACDVSDLFGNIPGNPKFMYSSIYSFSNDMVMSFFEELGLPYKVERGGRVFPKSDHSSDVIKVLEKELKKLSVDIRLNTKAKELIIKDGVVNGVFVSKVGDGGNREKITADSVILATGGISYSGTGANPSGYNMAKKTGHTIIDTKPSLVPFEIEEKWCKSLMGISLKNVGMCVFADGKKVSDDFGEMLFTHYGISGPMVIKASAYIHKYLSKKITISIDLKPALSYEQLDDRILRDFEMFKGKTLKNALSKLLLHALIPVIINESGLDGDKKVSEITKEERKRLAETIKNLKMTFKSLRGFDEAIITKGGINVKEIDPQTMESKVIKNLFFAGEMIDVDALTGGFNLQVAWSTGYLAGVSSANN